MFEPPKCFVFDNHDVALFVGSRLNNIYVIDLFDSKSFNEKCLVVVNNDVWLWHEILGHTSMHMISKLNNHDLINGLPKLKYEKDLLLSMSHGKHSKSSCHYKKSFLHLDHLSIAYRFIWSHENFKVRR